LFIDDFFGHGLKCAPARAPAFLENKRRKTQRLTPNLGNRTRARRGAQRSISCQIARAKTPTALGTETTREARSRTRWHPTRDRDSLRRVQTSNAFSAEASAQASAHASGDRRATLPADGERRGISEGEPAPNAIKHRLCEQTVNRKNWRYAATASGVYGGACDPEDVLDARHFPLASFRSALPGLWWGTGFFCPSGALWPALRPLARSAPSGPL
jgi:hypothetical protein